MMVYWDVVWRSCFGINMFSGVFSHAGFWSDMETQSMEATQHPNYQLVSKSRNSDGVYIVG